MRYFLSLILALTLVACSTPQPQPDATYYLVRHAEKMKDVPDPGLTEEGRVRAEDLAERLANANVTKIYSSDYVRTRLTAKPLAENLGLEVTLYDPRDLPSLAERLLSETGQIVVAGHSNTTPQLAELLGVEPGDPIVEETEYDRLYVLTRTGNLIKGEIQTYGK